MATSSDNVQYDFRAENDTPPPTSPFGKRKAVAGKRRGTQLLSVSDGEVSKRWKIRRAAPRSKKRTCLSASADWPK
jgi:hypothetical protein